MNWRWRQAGKAVVVAGGVLLVVWLALSKILLDGFERAEDDAVRQTTQGARHAFEQRISSFNERFADWSSWDGLYRFAQPEEPRSSAARRNLSAYRAAFVRSKLVPASLSLLRVNLLAIVSRDGRLLWGTSFESASNRVGPLPDAVLERLRPGSRLLSSRNGQAVQGLLQLPWGVDIVASRPIVKSDRSGPVRGFLIAGRPLDSSEWSQLRQGSGLDFSLLPLAPGGQEAAAREASTPRERELQAQLMQAFGQAKGEGAAASVVVQPLGEEQMAGFVPVRDLDGRLLGALRLVQPRALRQRGQSTLRIFRWAFWSLGLGALSLSLWVLRRSEARFRALVQNGWDIVAILRPDALAQARSQVLAGGSAPSPLQHSPQLIYISPGVSRVLGFGAHEVEGTSASMWIHPQDRDRTLEQLSRWMKAAEGARLEAMMCRWRHRDSSWRDLEITGAHWPRDPDIAGLVLNARDVSQEKKAQERLLAEAARFSSLLHATPEAVLIADAHNHIIASNPAAQNLFGYAEDELQCLNINSLLPSGVGLAAGLARSEAGEEGAALRPGTSLAEVMGRRGDGSEFPCELSLASWRSKAEAGEDEGFCAIILRNISGRKRDEARLEESTRRVQASLREKEVLLKEIHHRVKNNMQVISSILSLQASMLDDPSVRAALRESQGRIKSMSLIHEKLYRSDDLGRVDFSDYLRGLAQDLVRSHPPRGSQRSARLELELQPVHLSIDQAAPAGLLVNELLSNALKHAFRDFSSAQEPLLRVRLSQVEPQVQAQAEEEVESQVQVEVEDNGRGMEPGFEWRSSESLGLQLVSTLAEQLEGQIESSPGQPGGTRWQLRFQAPANRAL